MNPLPLVQTTRDVTARHQHYVVVMGVFYLRFRGAQRIKGFGDQFEMALRMMSGALRVGLGFRQAIILVTEEVPNPARRELLRVIGRANIGINISGRTRRDEPQRSQ